MRFDIDTSLRRSWPVIALGVAGALMLVRFMPAVTLKWFHADAIQGLVFLRDFLDHGRPASGFMWGGKSDLFPDSALLVAFWVFAREGLFALQGVAAALFAGLLAIVLVLQRQHSGVAPRAFAAILLLVFLWMAGEIGFRHGPAMSNVFLTGHHGGSWLMSLAGLALLTRARVEIRRGWPFWLLAAVGFLGAASDPLFLVAFSAPACAALVVARVAPPRAPSLRLDLLLMIAAVSGAGTALAQRLFPPVLATELTVLLRPEWMTESLAQLFRASHPAVGGSFGFLVALGVAVVVVAVVQLVRGRAPFVLVFTAAVVGANFGAVILTGRFPGLGATRYLFPALLGPPLLAVGWMHAQIRWSEPRVRAVCATAALVTCAAALFAAPRPARDIEESRRLGRFLGPIMRTEGIDAGLADYWLANPVTYLSGDTVTLRPITRDGRLFHWVSNIEWFTGNAARPSPPFRLVLMRQLDAPRIRAQFGRPDRVLSAPGGRRDVWLYDEAHAIRYDPSFGLCGASKCPEPGRLHMAADALSTNVGALRGRSIVADGTAEGFLTYGPYLTVAPGRYRVVITSDYRKKPETHQLLRYDCVHWQGGAATQLDAANIPHTRARPDTFAREVTVPGREWTTIEVRIWYRGGGSPRIDAVDLISLNR